MRGKDFGRGVQVGMRVEESANVTREHPIFGLPGRIQRTRRLAVGVAYLLPARFAFGDKGWKLGLAARNSDCLFVRAPIGIRHCATYCARHRRADECARPDGTHRHQYRTATRYHHPTLFAILVVMDRDDPDGHAAVRMDPAQARDNETSSSGLRCLTSSAETSFALVPQLLQVFHARARGFPKRACRSGDNAFHEAKHGHGRIPLRWNARLDRKGDLRETRDG